MFHTYNSYIFSILVLVTIGLVQRLVNGDPLFTVYNDRQLEFFWTLCPSFILFGITWPSLFMIHYIERPRIGNSYEVIGNHWYWSYRQGAHNGMAEGRKRGREFDSTYVNGQLTATAAHGGENMWFLSSNDVIHNWGIPARRHISTYTYTERKDFQVFCRLYKAGTFMCNFLTALLICSIVVDEILFYTICVLSFRVANLRESHVTLLLYPVLSSYYFLH